MACFQHTRVCIQSTKYMYVEFYRFDATVLFLVTHIPVECGFIAQKVIFNAILYCKMSEIRPKKLSESLPTSHSEPGLVLWSLCE